MLTPTVKNRPWSDEIAPELYEFCKKSVLEPWEHVLEANRGEREGHISSFMGMGPDIPTWLLPWALHKSFVHTLLGPEPNMVTIILNHAHNRIVFFGAERAEEGKYLEMIRLDKEFSPEFQQKICRMLQAGLPRDAMDAIHEELHKHGFGRFRPGMLKITDLSFFESFLSLSKKKNKPLRYLAEMLRIANQVISRRSLYFYPQVPLETLLSTLHQILPKPRYQK